MLIAVACLLPGNGAAQASSGGMKIDALFSQLDRKGPLYDRFQRVLESPLVDGVTTALNWAAVDRGPGASGGQYQWRDFDEGIQRFIKAGKKVNLMVQPISYGSNNMATPSYVMEDRNVEKVSCHGGPGGADYENFPVVYAKAFKEHYKAFIREVVQHYSDNPHIGYIRFGLSVGNEIFPQCARQEAERSGMNIPQWRDKVWLPWHKEMMEYEKSLNPPMTIESPMTPFMGETIWTDTEAKQAAEVGFGFGLQGLQMSDIEGYPHCTGDWCRLFEQYAGKVPMLQLSTLGQTDPSGTCAPECKPGQRVVGPLPKLLAFAVEHHATEFELYPQDILIALDPKHPLYQQYHDAYAGAVAAARKH